MMDANHSRPAISHTLLRCWVAVAALLASDCCSGEELAGIRVRVEPAASPVSISLKMMARHRLQIDADGRSLESPAKLQIELPIRGSRFALWIARAETGNRQSRGATARPWCGLMCGQ